MLTALAASASAVLVALLPLVALGAAEEYAERPSNAPDAAAGAAYRVPKRVAAVNILWYLVYLAVGQCLCGSSRRRVERQRRLWYCGRMAYGSGAASRSSQLPAEKIRDVKKQFGIAEMAGTLGSKR